MRREWAAACLAFLATFAAVVAGALYLLLAHFLPERGWVDTIATGVRMLLYALLAGLGGAWAAMALVQRRHYRLGVYRCFRCDRALQGTAILCVCCSPQHPVQPRPRPPMRHYRRMVKPVLLTYLALLGPTLLLVHVAPALRGSPAKLAFLHALLCLLAGTGVKLADAVLECLHRGKRFRLRAVVFLRVFALWPLLVCVVGGIAGALGYDLL